MNLWHGTYEMFLEDILKDGELKVSVKSNVDGFTKELDELLIKYTGFNPRENCLYFSGDTESANGFDYAFKVDTNHLDKKLLYVADFTFLEKIYSMSLEDDSSDIKSLCDKYVESIISFDEYMKNKNNYLHEKVWDLEFLYFGNIPISEYDLD